VSQHIEKASWLTVCSSETTIIAAASHSNSRGVSSVAAKNQIEQRVLTIQILVNLRKTLSAAESHGSAPTSRTANGK